MLRVVRLPLAALLALTLLAGCESPEEKAERFYQSALVYLEDDDIDRALIELRNVFDHDGFHQEARALYAGLQLERGNVTEAYGQYLRLVEQYPDTVEAREALALMALDRRNWDEVQRHGAAAIALDPDRLGTRALTASLAYRDAVIGDDPVAATAAARAAGTVLDEDPTLLAARRVVIDDLLRRTELEPALTEIDAGLVHAPESLELNMIRTQVLAQLGREDDTGAQLTRMYALFPGNEDIRTALIRWYLTRQDFEGAAEFLRSEAGEPGTDIDGNLAVVELINRARGPEAAAAELDQLATASAGSAAAGFYRAQRARIIFVQGARAAAIAEVTAVLEGVEASDQTSERTNTIRLILAQMLNATDNPVGAREQIEAVLAADASNVEALKLRAEALIAADDTRAAIIDLRTALDQSPRDTSVLTLMAEAHLRDGSPELAQERLAVAVEVSNSGAAESLRYARFLMARDRPDQARTILTRARQSTPGNPEILGALAEIHLRTRQFAQAQDIIDTLSNLGGEEATRMARAFQSAMLLSQNQVDAGLDQLRTQIDGEGDTDLATLVQFLRSLILTDRLNEARAVLDKELDKAPGSVPLKMLSANLHSLQGEVPRAEALYRGLLAEQPDLQPAILQLQELLSATNREAEARAVVAAGLEALPASRPLRMLEAFRLEQEGDWEGAIAVYEALYQEDSSDVIVANNLASMLSNHRTDDADLDRAFAVARRLTGSEVPAFQDTLGWILFLRGNTEDAIEKLEGARAGLPEDPIVAFHLGLAYAEAGRPEDARRTLQAGFDLAGEADVPLRARARAALDAL